MLITDANIKIIMKIVLPSVAILVTICHLSIGVNSKMVCYYDTTSASREGPSKFTNQDMEHALQFCTHVIYGYGLTPKIFNTTVLHQHQKQEFSKLKQFKVKYPNVKFLLSIRGKNTEETTENFLKLLEADHQAQQTFINAALKIMQQYNFDGMSLDLPLPTETPHKVLSTFGKIWQYVKNFFTGNLNVDPKSKEHKTQITDLVLQLSTILKKNNLMLSLTVLPNVNSKWYFDAPAIIKHLDFVILSTFDFYTPDRNPEEADYFAPINSRVKRLPQSNVDYQVKEWLSQKIASNKIIVGVATWGRAWKMSKDSKYNGMPPVFSTAGPAAPGPETLTPGLLSWSEICQKFENSSNKNKTGAEAPSHRVVDPTKKYGNFAYRPVDKNGEHGMWISYEEPSTAALKAEYVKNNNLGGVALFDMSLDDLRGQCGGDKFPILKSIQFKLLQ